MPVSERLRRRRTPSAVAAKAFASWKRTTPSQRSLALLKIADLFEANAEELVAVEAENTGKIIALTMSEEIPPMIDQIRFFAGAARLLEGRGAAEYMEGMTSYVRREPIGVCAAVTPWNYPMMMAVWKWAPAIAAGNTMVLKPGDSTPASTLLHGPTDGRGPARGRLQRRLRRPRHRSRAGRAPDSRDGVDHRVGARRHGGRRQRPPTTSSACTSNSAARRRSSSLTTWTSPRPPRAIAIAGYFNAGQDCTAATRVLAGPKVYGDFVDALAEQASEHGHRPARQRRRAVRTREQRQPVPARHRVPRPRARARVDRGRRPTRSATPATSSSPRSSRVCTRTTR